MLSTGGQKWTWELIAPIYDCQARAIYPIVKPYTQDEIQLLLNAAEYTKLVVVEGKNPYRMKRPTADRDTAIMLTLLDTGIRASECARLRMSDVDLELGEIVIRPHGSSTKSRPRTVFLGKVARRALWRYVNTRQWFDEDHVFISGVGKPMKRNTIRHLLVNAGKRAGVKNVNVHRFRHTCAIEYLRNGGDVFTLQKILGHSSLDMVKKYLDIVTSDARTSPSIDQTSAQSRRPAHPNRFQSLPLREEKQSIYDWLVEQLNEIYKVPRKPPKA